MEADERRSKATTIVGVASIKRWMRWRRTEEEERTMTTTTRATLEKRRMKVI